MIEGTIIVCMIFVVAGQWLVIHDQCRHIRNLRADVEYLMASNRLSSEKFFKLASQSEAGE